MAKPAQIVAGIGCRRGTGADEIVQLLEATCDAAGVPISALVAIATLDRKAAEPGLLSAAAQLGISVRSFAAERLLLVQAPAAPLVHAAIGLHSVAEAAAAQAGPLLLSKLKSAGATCALALAGSDFDLASFGQATAAPVSTAVIAASMVLTSNAGP